MHKGKEFILPGMILPKVQPMEGGPIGKLFYFHYQDILIEKFTIQIDDDTIFSLEEQIRHYDSKYEDNIHYDSLERAYDGLMKSIYYRSKKILRDHG